MMINHPGDSPQWNAVGEGYAPGEVLQQLFTDETGVKGKRGCGNFDDKAAISKMKTK